jgi:hypothetical protein
MLQGGLLGETETVQTWQRAGVVFGEDPLNLSSSFDILRFEDSLPVVSVTAVRFLGEKTRLRLSCSDLTISVVETLQTYPAFTYQLFPLKDQAILEPQVLIAKKRNVRGASRYENPGDGNTPANSWQSRSSSDHRALQGGGKKA